MSLWLYLLLLLPAAPLTVEDFRSRRVSVFWLGVLGVLAFVLTGVGMGWRTALLYAAVNCVLSVLLMGLLVLWLLIRRKQPRQLFRTWFGMGDLVFMAAITPLFGPEAYVRFLLVACLAALAWWGVRRSATIPLAGIMALTLAGYAICKTAGLWS